MEVDHNPLDGGSDPLEEITDLESRYVPFTLSLTPHQHQTFESATSRVNHSPFLPPPRYFFPDHAFTAFPGFPDITLTPAQILRRRLPVRLHPWSPARPVRRPSAGSRKGVGAVGRGGVLRRLGRTMDREARGEVCGPQRGEGERS